MRYLHPYETANQYETMISVEKEKPAGRRQFYGRRMGHKLHPHQAQLMTSLLPEIKLPLGSGEADIKTLFDSPIIEVWLEIGFGAGEHLLWQAERNPGVGHIGCEPYVNGVAKVLSAIEAKKIENIRLHDDDVSSLFDVLPGSSISRVFILFPDPWPKKRHHKRRIISDATLTQLARIMKTGAELRFASDIPDYVDWALRRILRNGEFIWLATNSGDWKSRPRDWPQTRYEQKAVEAGRVASYLRFARK